MNLTDCNINCDERIRSFAEQTGVKFLNRNMKYTHNPVLNISLYISVAYSVDVGSVKLD